MMADACFFPWVMVPYCRRFSPWKTHSIMKSVGLAHQSNRFFRPITLDAASKGGSHEEE
jgi:hypothetical protein